MKKYILLFLFISGIAFAQDANRPWFTPKQQATIDSLFSIIDTLGLSGFSSLSTNKFYVGSLTGVATPREMTGDGSLNYLGQFSIGTGVIVNADINASAKISATKIGANSNVSDTEYGYLDGVTSNIQDQITDFAVGTGFLLAAGDNLEGNLIVEDDVYLVLGEDTNMGMYYDSGDDISNFLSNNKLRIGTTTSDDFEFYSGGSLRLTLNSSGVLIPESDIIPSVTNTSDLGSTTNWFDNVFGRKILFRTAYSNDSPSGAELSIPSHLTHPTTAGTFRHNDIYTLSQDSYYDVTGSVQDKNGFYLLAYYDEDPLTRPYFPDSTEIENMVDARLMASAKTLSAVETDSIDFTNTNTIFGYYQASDEFEIYFANYQSNIAQQIVIYTQYDININPPAGVTLLYADGLPITVSGIGYYRIWFTYLSSTLCLVDWNVYEAP